MERYLNKDGNSGVRYYEIESERIIVRFSDGSQYSYSYRKAGQRHVEQMKLLARSGSGLNSYIMRNVRFSYD